MEIRQLLRIQSRIVRGVAIGHHHQVAIVVGVAVEDGEAPGAPSEDEVLPVRLGSGLGRQEAEDASFLAGRVDELAPPRGPEVIHQGSPAPGDGMSSWGPGAESTSAARLESACTSDCASSPKMARNSGRSLVGYSMVGSPRSPASLPASRAAS